MRALVDAISRVLIISTAHVSQETCSAAEKREIDWAVTNPTEHGFLAYCHEERTTKSHDDLWDVLQFALRHGCQYVLFDRDAVSLDQDVAGLPLFDW